MVRYKIFSSKYPDRAEVFYDWGSKKRCVEKISEIFFFNLWIKIT